MQHTSMKLPLLLAMNAEPGTLAEPSVNQRLQRVLEGDRNRL